MSGLLDAIYQKAEDLRIPLNVLLELTNRCNENCLHCYIKDARDINSLSNDDKELTRAQVTSLLDELAREGALNLILSGGEAMLREDFFDIAYFARSRNFAITIFSNGQLLDQAKAKRLADLSPVCIYFSLYGSNADTHDRVTRVPGSFEKLQNAVILLKQNGLKVGLKTILMRGNIAELKEIYDLGLRMGIETHQFAEEITSRIDGSGASEAVQIDEFALFAYYRQDVPNPPEYIKELPQEEARKKEICSAGTYGVAVSCYGDVYPCAELRLPLGNIKNETFGAIWKKQDSFLEKLRSIKQYGDLEDCRECALVNFCRRCHGQAWYEAGDWSSCYENAHKRAFLNKRINTEIRRKKEVIPG